MKLIFFPLFTLIGLTAALSADQTYYVSLSAKPNGDGSSWGSAFQYLEQALAVSEGEDTILIAEGLYKPHRQGAPPMPADTQETFTLQYGVSLFGGYSADGTQRNPLVYKTVLSGDIYGDLPITGGVPQGQTTSDRSSWHIITLENPVGPYVFDGLWFANGNTGGTFSDPGGSAISAAEGGEISINNCHFRFNTTENQDGGAIYYIDGTPGSIDEVTIANSTFVKNGDDFADPSGTSGAVYIENESLTVTDCVFESNRGANGGAIYFEGTSAPTQFLPDFVIQRSFFRGNFSSFGGGAILVDEYLDLVVEDCVFSGNHAGNFDFANGDGGAIVSFQIRGSCNIRRNTFAWNTCGGDIDGPASQGGAFCRKGSPSGLMIFEQNLFHENYSTGVTGPILNSVSLEGSHAPSTLFYWSNYAYSEDLPNSHPDRPNFTLFQPVFTPFVEFEEAVPLVTTTSGTTTRYAAQAGGDLRLVQGSGLEDLIPIANTPNTSRDALNQPRYQGRGLDPGGLELQPPPGTLEIVETTFDGTFFRIYFKSSSEVDVFRSSTLSGLNSANVYESRVNSPSRYSYTPSNPKQFFRLENEN